ncbi:terpene cyclase [Neopestalotiopsis sp. 37M]|nr:terpene cyclase [Neopestalotiopsis sp. 37M]
MDSKTCQPGSQDEAKVVVRIPNLFVGFLAEEPNVNPFYGSVKLESEAWINEFCKFDKRMASTINKCDFSYFMAITAPEASTTTFRTLCDWGNWVFPYDDMFDNGVLRNDPTTAKKVMDDLMEPLLHGELPQRYLDERTQVLKVHDQVWHNLLSASTPGIQRRFAQNMSDYCAGVLLHVEDACNHQVLTPEDMLARRQLSAGVSPIFPLVEYACELRLPDHILEHEIIKELEQVVTDFVLIINDILSYMKEEAELVPHNLVAVARMNGLGPQEAFDYIGQMLDSRHSRWEQAIKSVPSWDHEIDCQVLKYIQGISNVAKANLYWSLNRLFSINTVSACQNRGIIMTAHFEKLPTELVDSIVKDLDVTDVGSLRLTSSRLHLKATQSNFRSLFHSMRIKIMSPELEILGSLTREGSLGCEVRHLTLVGIVKSTRIKRLGSILEARQGVDDTRQSRKSQEQQHHSESPLPSKLIEHYLTDAFKNIAANSVNGKLHSLSLEVAEYNEDANHEVPPLHGGSVSLIWRNAADTCRSAFLALQESRLQVDDLNIFNGPDLHRCSISSHELKSINYSSDGHACTLKSINSLSISFSDRIIPATVRSHGERDGGGDLSNSDDEEGDYIEGIVGNFGDKNKLEGLAGLIHACKNLKSLCLHQYGVNPSDPWSRIAIASERTFHRGIATLNKLPPIKHCTLNGIFLRESDLLAFLKMTSTSLQALFMDTVTLVVGSYTTVFGYIASSVPNLNYPYLDELRCSDGVMHFTGIGKPRFSTFANAHGATTLKREGRKEAQQPFPYHFEPDDYRPLASATYLMWAKAQRQKYGPP